MAPSASFELCICACCAKLMLHYGPGFMFVQASHQELQAKTRAIFLTNTFEKKPFLIALNVSVHVRSRLIGHALFFLKWSSLGSFNRKGKFNLTSSLAIDSLYIGKEW